MGDAKRVDLDALRDVGDMLRKGAHPQMASRIDDAIAEIEAACACASSPTGWLTGTPPDIVIAALDGLRNIMHEAMGYLSERRERGPSRAERLVRYRCAVAAAYPLATPGAVETGAHTMLAAEREPSS